jgi:hypothetical protein
MDDEEPEVGKNRRTRDDRCARMMDDEEPEVGDWMSEIGCQRSEGERTKVKVER